MDNTPTEKRLTTIEDILAQPRFRALLEKWHHDSMIDPIYRAGYESTKSTENPHEFPKVLDIERIRIGIIERPLTPDECTRLRALNAEFDAAPWQRWGQGHHYRHHTEGENGGVS